MRNKAIALQRREPLGVGARHQRPASESHVSPRARSGQAHPYGSDLHVRAPPTRRQPSGQVSPANNSPMPSQPPFCADPPTRLPFFTPRCPQTLPHQVADASRPQDRDSPQTPRWGVLRDGPSARLARAGSETHILALARLSRKPDAATGWGEFAAGAVDANVGRPMARSAEGAPCVALGGHGRPR